MEKKLAIVIPAYKAERLAETLESIAAQDCQAFNLYVCDDASPYHLENIVRPFSEKTSLQYIRFEKNRGAEDLVGQWERSIEQVGEEEWIWLFSDDDIMPQDAVTRFYQALDTFGNPIGFFRFPLCRIDKDSQIEYECTPLPAVQCSAEEMLLEYLAGNRPSAACEYIFSKRIFTERKMVHFPLAWCADTATWYDYAQACGAVYSLNGQPVCWRNAEGSNISNTKGLQKQKMQALILFVNWLTSHYKGRKNARFAKALRNFIKTNLHVSLEGLYEKDELKSLCQAYASFSRLGAWTLYRKYSKIK